MSTWEGRPGGPWREVPSPMSDPWATVGEIAVQIAGLANDGLDHPGDDAIVRDLATRIGTIAGEHMGRREHGANMVPSHLHEYVDGRCRYCGKERR